MTASPNTGGAANTSTNPAAVWDSDLSRRGLDGAVTPIADQVKGFYLAGG